MAQEQSVVSHPVVFTTQSPYPLPTQKFMIPASWKRFQLSQLVNKALSLLKPVPFDFLIRGELLRGTLGDWCNENGVGEEETLEIEYIQSVLPPQKLSEQPHDDWISSVTCQFNGHILTGSYDGQLRVFDYAQKTLLTHQAHQAPITSVCVVPSHNQRDEVLIATSSHDLTAQLTNVQLHADAQSASAAPLASLHLHTAPISAITSNVLGTRLLTASWDALIGVFDATMPPYDQVPLEYADGERKKRRKVETGHRGKRKAPLVVMKSHTTRVSKALFVDETHGASCGFDSTVRTWDIESGVCVSTIVASEKPFLDMALDSPQTAFAASSDRTVSHYDLRSSSAVTPVFFTHPCTPSSIVVSPHESSNGGRQVISGGYDGIVRVWDIRSTKGPVTSFKAWGDASEPQKVLGVDWAEGAVGVGGESGLSVWRIGEPSLLQ